MDTKSTIMEEDEMEDLFDDDVSSNVGSSLGSLPPGKTIRPPTTVRARLGRTTLVCTECKRLKLKCDRRTPCDQCTNKKRECKYDPGALAKIDVQSVHNAQLRTQQLLEAIVSFLGTPDEEVQMIMNAPTFPPRPDWTGLTIDAKRLRAALGLEGNISINSNPSNPNTNIPDSLSLGRNAPLHLPPAIVAFSRAPPQIPAVPSSAVSAPPRRGQVSSVMVDLATRVFQANSLAVSSQVLAQLRLWQRVLGWEPKAAYEGAIPSVAAGEDKGAEEGDMGAGVSARKMESHSVLVTAPPSEIEYHDQPRPKDLSVVALAQEVFIMPALAHQQATSNSSSTTTHISSSFPQSFSALGLGSSASSPQPPISSPRSSVSPSPGILPLVTPQIVLRYLPPKSWRTTFMNEFDQFMIVHDGIGVSGRHSVLKRRIELMFDWADGCLARLRGGAGGSGESGPDSASTFSTSSSSFSRGRRSNSTPSGKSTQSRSNGAQKPLPPPPTLGLFAVACAVYALGALSYASRSAHGSFPEDDDEVGSGTGTAVAGEMPPPPFPLTGSGAGEWGLNMADLGGNGGPGSTGRHAHPDGSGSGGVNSTPSSTPFSPHTHAIPDKSTPHTLYTLARATLLAHDESSLPPSLDYLHAHMLTWVYALHPSDSASALTSCGFAGASTGVGSGGMTVVERGIWKELGKCVCVARAMGLDLVDRGGGAGMGRMGADEESEEGMGVWEKEMRRRVWWQLMMFDQQIADDLGHLPLIPPGTYACKPPTDADESAFGPTATTIPKHSSGALGNNMTFFAYKCQLLNIIKKLSYAQLEDGVTMDLARQLENRISNWRSALPEQYKIDFREKPEDTTFNQLDTVDVQACDLHIMANVFLLRLWLPFFNEALSSTSQSNQGVLLTATTAANAVIVASHHLVTKYRAARPMSFGHYDFGNSVWFATGVLAAVVTIKPDVIFASTGRRGVEMAGALFKNQVLQGKADMTHRPKYEVNKIMGHITRLAAEAPKGRKGTGSKRKSDADIVDQMKMRYGVPIPFVGAAAMTSAKDINVPQAQSALNPESAFGWWRSPQQQDSDELSSVSAPQTRARTEHGAGASAGGPSDSERMRMSDEVSMFTAEGAGSWASSSRSYSQTSSSQSGRSRPAVGVRRRPATQQGSSPRGTLTPASSVGEIHQDVKQQRNRAVSMVSGSPSGEGSNHNSPSFSLSSSLPEPVTSAPPNQPPTSRPPPIHHVSAPTPILQQDRQAASQSRNRGSPNVTIGYLMGDGFAQSPQAGPSNSFQTHSPQVHPPPGQNQFGYYSQVQSQSGSAITVIDSRSHPYATPGSGMPQQSFPVAQPPSNAYLSNLQPSGGGMGHPQAESSHMNPHEHRGSFDMSSVLPISTDHSVLQNVGQPHTPVFMGDGAQFAAQPQPYAWANVGPSQLHGAPSRSASAQDWMPPDATHMSQYMGPH